MAVDTLDELTDNVKRLADIVGSMEVILADPTMSEEQKEHELHGLMYEVMAIGKESWDD